MLYLALLVLVVGQGEAFFRLMGPFETKIKSLERCPDQGTGHLKFDARFHKQNRDDFVLNGIWAWPYDVDDKMKVEVDAAMWRTGGWGLHAWQYTSKYPCEDARKLFPSVWNGLTAAANIERKCPIPAGNYTVKDWIVKVELPVSVMLYGQYRIDVSFFEEGVKFGCLRVFADILERVR